MSINPEKRAWWSEDHHQQQQQGILMETIQNSWLTTRRFNLNQDDEEGDDEEQRSSSCHVDSNGIGSWSSRPGEEEKEAMFEKPLTPSDVGKLNRLVIPKQHAEKYFPLAAANNSSGGVCDNKGLLLSFEDESGKCWRFRYSYWNSSQSYVLTKGWSRYVKDKRLDAGDVVSFLRHRTHSHRLYITWRRRHIHPPSAQSSRAMAVPSDGSNSGNNSRSNTNSKGISLGWTTTGFYPAHPYPTHHHTSPFESHSLHAGRGTPSQKQSSKVLRLFGVNMECQPDPDESGPSRPEYVSSSSSSNPHQQYLYQYHHHRLQASCASNPHHHMDVKQMRNRPG